MADKKPSESKASWRQVLPDLPRDVTYSVRVPESLRTRIRRFALDHGTTAQEVGIAAIEKYLKERGA